MPENLTMSEGLALALAEGGCIETPFGDAIPQAVWSGLYDRDLIRVVRDFSDEYTTTLTNEGRDALLEHAKAISHGLENPAHAS
jgi:hypothetical protein